jgi:putative flippase GtrA
MTELLRQSARFATVGLLNTAIGLAAIYAVMYFFRTGPAIANAVGYLLGIVVSFSLNRVWTFKSKRPAAQALPMFLLVAGFSYALNLAGVILSISYLSINTYLSQLVGVSTYTVCMFFGCRWFVFIPARTI